jgi:hypothetical protein
MMNECGAVAGMRFGRDTELEENLPQYHFVHRKFHMTLPGIEPGPPQWEAGAEILGSFALTDLKYGYG